MCYCGNNGKKKTAIKFRYNYQCTVCGQINTANFFKRRCRGALFLDKCESVFCSARYVEFGVTYSLHVILGRS